MAAEKGRIKCPSNMQLHILPHVSLADTWYGVIYAVTNNDRWSQLVIYIYL